LVSLRLHNRGRIAARGDRSSARNQFSCAVGPNAIVLRGRATNGAAVGAISRLRVALGSIIHCNTRGTGGTRSATVLVPASTTTEAAVPARSLTLSGTFSMRTMTALHGASRIH